MEKLSLNEIANKYIDKLIEYLIEKFNDKGIKGIAPIICVILSALVFISPSYIFIVLYKINLFKQFNLIINIINVLIFDGLLFSVLFVIGSFRGIKIDEKTGKYVDNSSLSKDIIITILLMGLISMCLIIVYGVSVIIQMNDKMIIGIITVGVTLGIIFTYYFFNMKKLKKKSK